MRLSTKGRYGARAMLDLALNSGKGPVLLRDIAKRQEVSEKYLEHSITTLRKAGLVRSIRGARGGYVLAKLPSQIRLSEIMEVLEGSMAPVECVDDPQVCQRAQLCVTRDIWAEMKEAIDNILESITLQDMVERQNRKKNSKAIVYNI
ncbi:Rrf2 family transcriptional regulator [Candidatus Aerophobetes bacterium]|uniref:Rrf2 family transcriptional regulator n=1 Tax=Aerophobetes bacterium TaxID=2030807 RepID=A0A523TC40_UNCAE|nr:MAG: Rrf2 family transcriptional regulator [Candidatus Aerophobetes bacterium]